MSKIGYIRVSSIDQNTDRQEIALAELQLYKTFTEKVSGKNTDRKELKKMLDYVREGDTLYIESFSRLSRSVIDLLSKVKFLDDKGVKLISLKENFDTSTPQGKLMLNIFASLYQFERECSKQRQIEGIEAAKRKGKHLGRRKKDIQDFQKIYKRWKREEITAVEAFKKLKISKSTFYSRVKKEESK